MSRQDVYVRLEHGTVARTISVTDDVNIDFNAAGNPIGVEILGALGVQVDGELYRPFPQPDLMSELVRISQGPHPDVTR
jgi:hypothetical protein